MMRRSLVVWLGLVVLAVVNGAIREALIAPRLGERAAHVASTITLCAAIVVVTWLVINWIAPATTAAAWVVGSTWLVLTLAFELLAGHYLFGASWQRLLGDYDVLSGRVWILVPLTTWLAPWLAASWQGVRSMARR
jgi:hypothetical protein